MTSEEPAEASHRSIPTGHEFREFIASGWAPRQTVSAPRADVADYAASRRDALSLRFPGERLVVPAGGLKVRSNDTDFIFRPHTAFAYLSGLGADCEPDSVLVLEPMPAGGHAASVYFRPLAPRDSEEFFADARYGEFWVGPRPSVEELESRLGINARHIDELPGVLTKDTGGDSGFGGHHGIDSDQGLGSDRGLGRGLVRLRVVRDADEQTTRLVDQARAQSDGAQSDGAQSDGAQSDGAQSSGGQSAGGQSAGGQSGSVQAPGVQSYEADEELARYLSGVRIIKDQWEVGEMRKAIAATHKGFEGIIAALPEAVRKGRGERWVEGVFGLYARHEGNGVGYESICASGDHANTIHWIRNDGEVRAGDLILVDAGVEIDSLFTADITRTLPVTGRFSEAQRKIYDAVLEAQQAGLAAVKPGNRFRDVHAAANEVIARRLYEWGLLPDGLTLEQTLDPKHGGWHRRWMVHGTSHHLGMDVHDCQLLLRQDYMDGELRPGMVLTVEPGLYFKVDDLLAPEDFRGIGVRIEDDVLVTEDGHENLSEAMPRTADDVEAWIARVWSTPPA